MRELCVEWFCTWSWYPEEKDECGEESIREKGARTTPWKPVALLNAGSGKVSLESTDDWDLLFIFSHPLPISTEILPWKSWAGSVTGTNAQRKKGILLNAPSLNVESAKLAPGS